MSPASRKTQGPSSSNQLFVTRGVDFLAGKPLGALSESEMFGVYAMGYRYAVDILLERITRSWRSRAEKDFLLYPIAFCARHHLELALKEVYLLVADCRNKKVDLRRELKSHELVRLWGRCLPMVRQVWPKGPEEDLTAASQLLAEFEEHDARSFAFRYPVDLNGQDSLPNLDPFDLKAFYRLFANLSRLLEGISSGLSAVLEARRELSERASRK